MQIHLFPPAMPMGLRILLMKKEMTGNYDELFDKLGITILLSGEYLSFSNKFAQNLKATFFDINKAGGLHEVIVN